MTTITVCKVSSKKLDGWDERSRKAYAKFRKILDELALGECLSFSYWFPRSPKLHRRHFAILAAVFDAQEQFDDPDALRMWLQCGAGHCTFAPGPSGKMVAGPKSIAWDKLDDAEFYEHSERVIAFLRSPRATGFLWSHLEPSKQAEMVNMILEGFER